jgi:hypothetical protein
MRDNTRNRNTKERNLTIGDHVLLKQSKKNKWSTAYEPWFYIVTRVDGSSIAARRIQDGRKVYRDASQYKLANSLIKDQQPTRVLSEEEIVPQDIEEHIPDKAEEQLNSMETTVADADTEPASAPENEQSSQESRQMDRKPAEQTNEEQPTPVPSSMYRYHLYHRKVSRESQHI